MDHFPKVSFVLAVRNEERFIGRCLDSIIAQDYPADKIEILAVDGMSEDRTRDILGKYTGKHSTFKIIDNPDKITPVAFNLGIKNATGDVITIVSAHSTISKDYISSCIHYLKKKNADNVGGPMRAVGTDYISKAIALAYDSTFGLGGGRFHDQRYEGEVDTVYLGCWLKGVFEKVGLFDERLVRNQDIEFNSRLRKSGGKIFLTPEIKSYYYCRSNLKDLWVQNFRTGLWNIKTIKLSPDSLSLRHFIPLLFVLSLTASWFIPALWFSIVMSYIFCNLFFTFRAAIKNGFSYVFILPVIFLTVHLSYGLGSFAGLLGLIKENRQ